MKKSTKLLLAAATVWPFLYFIIFFAFIFSMILFMPQGGDEAAPAWFLILFLFHFLTIFLILGLTVFYMVNVFRNERVDKDKKVLWAVVLFLGNIVAMPVYWYLYIWRDEKTPPSNLSGGEQARLNSPDATSWTNESSSYGREKEYGPPREPPNWRE